MIFYGGEGGIRTLGTLPYTHFPGVLFRPLRHLTGTGKHVRPLDAACFKGGYSKGFYCRWQLRIFSRESMPGCACYGMFFASELAFGVHGRAKRKELA